MNLTQNMIKLQIKKKKNNSKKSYQASNIPPLTESLGLILQFASSVLSSYTPKAFQV